jgi:hypothetical protein
MNNEPITIGKNPIGSTISYVLSQTDQFYLKLYPYLSALL